MPKNPVFNPEAITITPMDDTCNSDCHLENPTFVVTEPIIDLPEAMKTLCKDTAATAYKAARGSSGVSKIFNVKLASQAKDNPEIYEQVIDATKGPLLQSVLDSLANMDFGSDNQYGYSIKQEIEQICKLR